jgi:GTP diphosphokinase / guanosine-3',5'-bis(diphosphate) 3'-diphosphatase
VDYASSLLSFLPGGRRAPGISQLVAKLESYLPASQVERVQEAYELANESHRGQKRMTGEAYITHPVAVAMILADLHLDGQTVCAALLHDVIEDTPTAKDEIVARFGREVGEIVDGVSKLDKVQFKSKQEAQAESFRKMILAMVRDIRVIMVKLADRTHNMRTMTGMPAPKRRRIAQETLEIYAPIANRLGIHSIKLELEDLGFKALYPQRYRVIERELKKARGNQKEFLPKIVANIEKAMKRAGMPAKVDSREKHLYSIYTKMRRKRVSLSEVIDVYGLRVVVDSVDACYRTLGVVHGLYKPMPGRFKDYIAIPRINGYQSLHTTLFGPNGVPLEVQIRTEDMHRLAENGIAAHWQYKSGEDGGSSQHERAREWLKSLMQMQEGGNSEEFLESVKVDLFPDKVYVFTPKGDILRLPRGATCVDFAYAVHTDVGNRCVAAKIDRRLVPLRTGLRNGQTVEVITAKGATPNPAWANFVVTAKARASIRQYLKTMKRSEAVDLGRRLVNQALGEFKLSVKQLEAGVLEAASHELGFRDPDDLYEKIGLGERLAPLVARRLLPADAARVPDGVGEDGAPLGSGRRSAPLAIAGTEGLVVAYARCCFPIPYDPIIAYLSAGRGVVIHRANCGNLGGWHKQPEKWLPVAWEKNLERSFASELKIEVANRMGVLAEVAARIAATSTNISHVAVVERDADTSTITLELQVRDRAQLARVVRAVRSMAEVLQVRRTLT